MEMCFLDSKVPHWWCTFFFIALAQIKEIPFPLVLFSLKAIIDYYQHKNLRSVLSPVRVESHQQINQRPEYHPFYPLSCIPHPLLHALYNLRTPFRENSVCVHISNPTGKRIYMTRDWVTPRADLGRRDRCRYSLLHRLGRRTDQTVRERPAHPAS